MYHGDMAVMGSAASAAPGMNLKGRDDRGKDNDAP
jgi:hypothetical protein